MSVEIMILFGSFVVGLMTAIDAMHIVRCGQCNAPITHPLTATHALCTGCGIVNIVG